MSIQRAEAAMHQKQISQTIEGYAPLIIKDMLDIRPNGSAFVAVYANGERHSEFFTEDTVDAAAKKVKDKIRKIYISLAN